MRTWTDDQEWERSWWGSCLNTFAEEAKQITYAHRMGMPVVAVPSRPETWPCYDAKGKSIIDIGGGPSSLLLKTINRGYSFVVDPCRYPTWVMARYAEADIVYARVPAEGDVGWFDTIFDECWIYNCLQHTMNPEAIVDNAKAVSRKIRIFEWIDREPCVGHPQTLKADILDEWLGGTGTVEDMKGENGCWGPAYYGVFDVR